MPKHQRQNKHQQEKPNGSTDGPEIAFAARGVDDALEVHAEIGSEEGEGEEDDGHAGEDEDGFVLGVGDDGEFVLFDGFELEELLCGELDGGIIKRE